jgi:hypothetical protein
VPDVGILRPLSTVNTSFASSLSAFAAPLLLLGAWTVAYTGFRSPVTASVALLEPLNACGFVTRLCLVPGASSAVFGQPANCRLAG